MRLFESWGVDSEGLEAECSCKKGPSSITMSLMSCHAEGPEADAGCDQEVNASECCPVDAESRAAWSRGVVAPGPAGKGNNREDGGTTAGRDTGALMREETIVLPSDSGAKTLALLNVEGNACPGA